MKCLKSHNSILTSHIRVRSKCTFYRLALQVFWSDVATAYRDPFSWLAGAGFVSEANAMANA